VFKTQLLPWLVHEVRSPIFNVKHPDGQTDEEIVAEVERKVVQMIGNYTHKEWECAQKILKHPGCVNRIFDELKILYQPQPKPAIVGKKMQPPGNIGSEPAKPQRRVNRAKRLERQKVPQKALKPKMSSPSGRQRLQKLPCLRLLKNIPSY
jgi:hypothetical protein